MLKPIALIDQCDWIELNLKLMFLFGVVGALLG